MTYLIRLRWVLLVLWAFGFEPTSVAQDLCESRTVCPEGEPAQRVNTYCESSKFWFEAEQLSGAAGDVVGVTVDLHAVDGFEFDLSALEITIRHDAFVAEVLGEPVFSAELLERDPFLSSVDFFQPEGYPESGRQYGFSVRIGPLLVRASIPASMPLMTVYYRLIGAPGDRTELSFSGIALQRHFCQVSGITDSSNSNTPWPLLSSHNQAGSLTIRAGPITRPNRPPEPPEAEIYDEPPTSEQVNLRVRIADSVATPGSREVPIDVFVTADVEYIGVVVPIDFDERYLRVARVEDHFLSGTAIVDNEDASLGAQAEEGFVVVASHIRGTRRIAAAREEFHAATIYVDVLESAAEVARTTLVSRSVGGRVPHAFVVVRHRTGADAEQVDSTSEMGVVDIVGGGLDIRESTATIRGDANFDGNFDVSDPVLVISYLFLGQAQPLCARAADYEPDGRIDISDSIRMLGALFLGREGDSPGEDDLVECLP